MQSVAWVFFLPRVPHSCVKGFGGFLTRVQLNPTRGSRQPDDSTLASFLDYIHEARLTKTSEAIVLPLEEVGIISALLQSSP